MHHHDPTVSDDEPTVNPTSARDNAAAQDNATEPGYGRPAYDAPGYQAPGYDAPASEPGEPQDEWLEEPEELPRRPRRRLLTPVPLALAGILLTACGFIGGVLVEKGQTSSTSASPGSAASVASRIRALGGGGARAGGASSGAAGGLFGAAPGASGGSARPTAGSVAYVDGGTLYLTTAEGNTVKVSTSDATSVRKSVSTSVKSIHPGEKVTIIGATSANGSISAESISVGSGGGGLAALFGAGARSSGAGNTSSGKAAGEPALFGSGG
jgi:hypothetical protein